MCVLLLKKIVKDHLPLKVVVQLEIAKQDGIVVVIVNLTVTKIQAGSVRFEPGI